MTDAVIVANTFVFLVAGADTVSSTVTFALLCLSQASRLQDRVHQEVKAAIGHHNGQWTYQSVKDMVYLDRVIQETLRLYPITFQLFRVCTEPYQIPDSKVVIEKGTRITVPIYSIHRDPRYYPAPEEFDPDRFVDNNYKPSGHYLPFGNGPRNCIGMRFAILEVKIVLAKILLEFSVKLNKKTQLPLKYINSTTTMLTEQGIWFDFEKRANS
uniref:Cytochrome P450 n=1 Tax=Clastoptera arizonana TaxID=38151 RepID=A0A1B6CD09_9HEMI